MSFLTRAQPLARTALRTQSQVPRLFSTAVVYHKSPTESVKDGLKAVDRTVSDTIVAGIDKGGKFMPDLSFKSFDEATMLTLSL